MPGKYLSILGDESLELIRNRIDAKRRKLEDGRRRSARRSSVSEISAIDRCQSRVNEILDRHDDHIRMLFHLETFVSLVNYDPQIAKTDHSTVFLDYKEKYDLLEKVKPSVNEDKSRSTRLRHKQSQVVIKKEEPEPAPAPAPVRQKPKSVAKPKPQAKAIVKPSPIKSSPKNVRKLVKARPSSANSSSRRRSSIVESEEFVDKASNLFPIITHPSHLIKQAGSLDSYLNSFVSLDEDMSPETRDKVIDDRVDLIKRINNARARNPHLFESHDLLRSTPAPQQPIVAKPTYQDHLVSQAVYFSRLISEERRQHVSRAKRISTMIDLYFKRLSGQEEKDKKLEEKRIRQLARKTANDVLKKWKLAEKVVQQRRLKVLQDHQRHEGKKQLNQILQHSAQLLESRVKKDDLSDEESDNEFDESNVELADYGNEKELEFNGDESNEDDDSEVMSESDTSEEEVEVEEELDGGLTVEELKKKYAALEHLKLEDEEKEEEEEEQERIIENGFEDSEVNGDVNGDVNGIIANGHLTAGSESDESILMDSEDEISKDGEEEEEEEEDRVEGYDESEEDEEVEQGGLASLFGNGKVESDHEDHDVDIDVDEEEDSGDKEKSLVKVPFLLRGTLREYQHYGLDWLAGLYRGQTNGILADEMGLGKTIQTIALLAYLACEKHIWGPHLIIVPTSVMLNWEMEFKRFCPGFKVLTYYGNPTQRKEKRKGWNKEDSWHVCITSYQLVLQDQPIFRRKKWHYMILDEAHNIKNFRSQRWQALLNFNSERRLLLTGTPLQNNLMELWSLLYFLMPSSKGSQVMPAGFANLKDFQEWFSKPVDKLVEEQEGFTRNEKGDIVMMNGQSEKDEENSRQ